MNYLKYTINEHLSSSSIANDDVFCLLKIPNNNVDNLAIITNWLKQNPSTRFKYINGRLKNNLSKLSHLKNLYPNVKFITTVDDPRLRLLQSYKHHAQKSVSLKQFVQLVASNTSIRFNILDNYPPDNSIIFLRNEYIASDFAKFFKSSDDIFTLTDPIDYNKLFDAESNNTIRSIFRKDIEFFYPDLSS